MADEAKKPASRPPTLAPVVAPTLAPVVAPRVAPKKPAPAEEPPGPVGTSHRAADRVSAFTGAPVAVVVAAVVFLLGALGAVLAWHLARGAAAGALDAADALGASTARLLAALEPDWWDPKHGTAEEMRKHALESLDREELAMRALPEGEAREKARADLALAKEKFLPLLLPNRRGADDLLESRNRERFRKVAYERAIVGVDFFDVNRRPLRMGSATPDAALDRDGEGLRSRGVILFGREGKEVPVRLYLHPVTSRVVDPDTNQLKPAGYAGVALSVEPALAMMEEANRRALLIGGSVLGLALAAAVLAFALLAPLRRVVRDAEEFARGDFDHRPAAAGGGEIGALARAVARSALAAKDREAEALAKAAAAVPPPPDHRAVVGPALAPAALPRIPAWEAEGTSRPCFEIAGDAFEIAAAAGGRVSCILVETSLRGLPAAFLAAEAKNLFRGLAPSHESAAALLEAVGAVTGPRVPEGEELHALVVVADPATGAAEIARAGKGNPPVIWRNETKELEKVEVEGPPVRRAGGTGTGAPAGRVAVELLPRDRLTLVSDGMYRARNSRKEKFGEQRLDGLVLKFGPMNSTAFVNMVVNEVDLFHEGAPQRDDLTVLTVRRLK